MKILITRRGEMYYADFCDYEKELERGVAESEEEAIENLKKLHKKIKGVKGKHKIVRYG